jgi:ADP-ribose pyrophosphatase
MDKIKPSFAHGDYEIIKREVMYQGIYQLVRYEMRYKLFDGNWSQIVTRETLERSDAAAILLYDPLLDRVVLIEQIRPGAQTNPSGPWLLEIVAGSLDSNDENPEAVAIREAKEEAGYIVDAILPICEYFVSPGCNNEYVYLYCGKINASADGGIYGLKEENEDIRAFTVASNEAFAMLKNGQIVTSPAIISLLWLENNREKLKGIWQK